ncbi:MAG: Glutathione-regulated potassium-efflux system protein KefB [Candidatus Argoarchaeum ethanivorans]|uniref:Glutathione-regulated potassium-efflux system protein KefB n=1 Tax=Candidatus Argoarchaeum ethanivorans TaxID=2608793 RepID=A0A811TEC6_9EURY|nr:MAG: Glutathione-regulated potassium-efflux system protein KefB [Candidatus Argoarchaeum ethanivorans]
MEIPLLGNIVILLVLSIVVLFACSHLRIPTVVGFFLTGMLVGPCGLELIKAGHEVEILAEIGVILLLFTIGIEFSLESLLRIKKSVLMGGSLQVWLTVLAVFAIAMKLGQSFGESIFLGFLISLSSTAIVLKVIQERAEVVSLHGSTTLGVLIYQDIIIVPMMLFTPLLVGATANLGELPLTLVIKVIGIIVFVFVSAKWIVPHGLHQIIRTRNRELFLLFVVVTCLGFAWLFSSVGLSLALGAFLAGLVISESEYAHQALGNILPFHDIAMSFFFISIGMLLDVGFLFQHLGIIVLIALGVIALKTTIAGFATILLGFPIRTAVLVGLALSQIGEFSFVLSKTGVEYGLLTGSNYQLFLAVSVLTMAATSFTIAFAPRAADIALRLPIPERLKTGLSSVQEMKRSCKKNHLIIIGFGFNGRNLARAAKAGGIPYVIIEMNPETVREEKAKGKPIYYGDAALAALQHTELKETGEPIYYGDATHEEVLKHADINGARVVVIAISDLAATRRIVSLVRKLNPVVCILVRTRYLRDIKSLHEIGANVVIPGEFETSVEILTRVLRRFLVPESDIEKYVAEIRSGDYEILQNFRRESASLLDLKHHFYDLKVVTFRVGEKSGIVGKTLSQIDLRKEYDVTLLTIHRGSQILSNPSGDMQLCANDVLVVFGSPDKIAMVEELVHNPKDM